MNKLKLITVKILFIFANFLNKVLSKTLKLSKNYVDASKKMEFINKTANELGYEDRLIFLKHKLDKKTPSFELHNLVINQMYGDTEGLIEASISQNLLQRLFKLKEEVGNMSPTQALEEEISANTLNGKNLEPDFFISEIRPETAERESKNIIVHPMHKLDHSNEIVKDLHQELRSIFSKHIKSPFIIVNTRLWSTKPQSENFGGNTMHYDNGFEPGHMKIMVYLTPFDYEHGYFKYEKNVINNKKAGYCILFKNRDILHSGVPGTKFSRVSLEVTIMRSLVDKEQFNINSYWGRHLKSPIAAYKNSNLQ